MKKLALFLALALCLSVFPAQLALAQSNDTLVIAVSSDPSTLHPTDYSTTVEANLNNQIYDPLMRQMSLDGSIPLEPRIATGYEISEDGLHYTFHLREDATFHDGTPITAEDVKFSAELYQASKYQGSKVDGLDSIEVIDEHTIVFSTATPYAPFLDGIATIFVSSKAYYESAGADKFANEPVGSGPYKFVSHDIGSKVELEAYDNYYGGAASIKHIVLKVIADNTTVAVALQTGEIDFANIEPSIFITLNGMPNITIDTEQQSRFGFVAMNTEKYPFNEVKFRQAVSYAVDRENMIALALDGFGVANSNLLSPNRFGYSDEQFQYSYDPEKAIALLAEIGIETPYDLGAMYVAESYSTQAQVLQSDLQAVGLNVTIEIMEFNAYLSKLMAGDYGISVLAMALEGDTQMFNLALTTDGIGAANNARYVNADIDQWFSDAVSAVDESERYEIYNKIFKKVQDECVYVVMYNTTDLYAHNSKLTCPPFTLDGAYYYSNFTWAE